KLADTLGCRAYTSPEDMIALRPEVEAVLLCTPPVTHRALAALCMNQGCHVLCEKPFCLDVASARAMIRTAARQGVVLTMASKCRRSPRQHRPVLEPQQGAGRLPDGAWLDRHSPRRLEGIEVPPVRRAGVDRLRQGIRQGTGVPESVDELRAGDSRRGEAPHHQ